jgi:hypothetical protein
MWRGDAQRSGQWDGELSKELHLQWVRRFPPLSPAYENPRLQFDAGYEPVIKDGVMLIASSRNDSLTALDAATGEEKWRFYASGPIRLAPAMWRDRVYVGSDDGLMYCLDASSGKLLWQFRAAPAIRTLLGNGRLISTWPVRGGPVIADDTLYFAAGVWSFEGVFIYALDAATGETVWINDRTGFLYGQHPHDAQAFGGLTPQGYLVVNGDELIVPCGTALPARLDRATGKLKHFALPRQGRSPGSWFTAAARAKRRGQSVPDPALDQEHELIFDSSVSRERHEGGWHEGAGVAGARSRVTLGEREFAFEDGYPGVDGTVHSIVAADQKLFVVTEQGEIHCFGTTKVESKIHSLEDQLAEEHSAPGDEVVSDAAGRILAATGAQSGYALVLGAGEELPQTDRPSLAEALARQSDLHVVVIEPDAHKCDRLRRQLHELGLLGTRVAVLQAAVGDIELPSYMASLIVFPDTQSADLNADGLEEERVVKRLLESLRPFGGAAYFGSGGAEQLTEKAVVRLESLVKDALDGAVWKTFKGAPVVRRDGPLPGSVNYLGGWASQDDRVAAPLGVLWFDDALAHFKRAPQPMIVDGVMVSYDKAWRGWLDGDRPPYSLVPPTYSDIYTGRVLSAESIEPILHSLPTLDLNQSPPDQYRPASQENAWKPAPPVIGERINPLTGESEPRAIPKSYGCDGGVDYGNLYTLRSGTAAFYDKQIESGTVHISGPRSGCTNSVIPAGGILNVPYFFQGCTWSYPLPVGLALVSVPQEREQWAVWGDEEPQSIRRVGINFGAPGVRMTQAGTLWLDYPRAGGPAPKLDLSVSPETATAYYRHSLWIEAGEGWPWVTASGMEGLASISLKRIQAGNYLVRLYFAEPEADQSPGQRVFDVLLQGRTVLQDFDISKASGGAMRGVVKEFNDIAVDGDFELQLISQVGQPVISGIELITMGLPLDPLVTIEATARLDQLTASE